MRRQFQQGLTLIEMIISIVVIGIALSGVLSVMNLTVARSADPVIQHQALAIAEAYLEEILSKAFDNSSCPAGSSSERATYCSVDDYNSLPDNLVRDQRGNEIAVLGSYRVAVTVGAAQAWEGITAKRITVTASHPAGTSMSLGGYRAEY